MRAKLSIIILALIINSTYIINNSDAQWVRTGGYYAGFVSSLTSAGSNLIAGTSGNGIYLTSDNGATWINTAFGNLSVSCLASSGNNVFAGTTDIFLSTNSGVNWVMKFFNIGPLAFAINGNYVFAGTNGHGLYISSDFGSSWSRTSLYNSDSTVFSLAVNGTIVFAGTYYNGVYISSNNGTTWAQSSLNDRTINCLAFIGGNVVAGTVGSGIYYSSNNGANWIKSSLDTGQIRSFASFGNNIFAGTDGKGVFLSTDYGRNWIEKNTGYPIPLPEIMSLYIANGFIYAGENHGDSTSYVWRRPYSEIIGINNISSNVLEDFKLYQNYPNPFNPTTKIRFDIAREGDVKIIVYDIQGRELQTLVNESLQPGAYEASFEGSGLNSGVYFYKLMADGFTETKRMLLVK